MVDAPKYEAPPPDPTITALNERAKQDDMLAQQSTARIDTAALMARYGTRLAMAGGGGGAVAPATPFQSPLMAA